MDALWGIRRRAAPLVGPAAAFLALLAPSPARAEHGCCSHTLASDPLIVEAYDDLGIKAFQTGAWETDGTLNSFSGAYGVMIRFANGPLAGETPQSMNGGWNMRPERLGAPERVGDEIRQEAVMAVARWDGPAIARIHQVVRVRDRRAQVRVTQRVVNLLEEPLRFRLTAIGDVGVTSGNDPIPAAGTPRFMGTRDPQGVVGGVEEVASSQLPADAMPVPVPPWDSWSVGHAGPIEDRARTDERLDDRATAAEHRQAAAMQWSDRWAPGAGLAPGAEARYEALWHVERGDRLDLLGRSGRLGATARRITLRLRPTTRDGEVRPGAVVRWTHDGREGSATAGADGVAEVVVTSDEAGRRVVDAYADLDGDGARDAGEPSRRAVVYWQAPLVVTPHLWPFRPHPGWTAGWTPLLMGDEGQPPPGAKVRWWVDGANAREPEALVPHPEVPMRAQYTGERTGEDRVHFHGDLDGDGTRDDGEPLVVWRVTWVKHHQLLLTRDRPGDYYAGQPGRAIIAKAYDPHGEPLPGATLRWRVDRGEWREATTGVDGRARLPVASNRPAEERIEAYADEDGSDTRNDLEPDSTYGVTWKAPPPTFETERPPESVLVGEEAAAVAIRRADFAEPRAGVPVRWAVTGANAASGTVATGDDGRARVAYRPLLPGHDTLSLYSDDDGDGTRDEGEPGAALPVRVRAQPPPEASGGWKELTHERLWLTVEGHGGVHAYQPGGEYLFDYPTGMPPGFFLRFSGGPLNAELFGGPGWSTGGGYRLVPLAQSDWELDGDDHVQTTTSLVQSGDVRYARVEQTLRYRAQSLGFRLAYRVTNLSPVPLRFRALAAGDLARGGDEGRMVLDEGPPRVAGAVGARQEVSTIAGAVESAAAPWDGYDLVNAPDLLPSMHSDDGLAERVAAGTVDTAVAVEWEDRLREPLAPGATAEYALRWRVDEPVPLVLRHARQGDEVGDEHEVTATVVDADGAPVEGGLLRWTVAGANPGAGTAGTAGGEATIRWSGRATGEDTVTVHLDRDRDGAHDAGEPMERLLVAWWPRRPVTRAEPGAPARPDGRPSRTTGFVGSDGAWSVRVHQPDWHAFPACAGGARMNLPLRLGIDPGYGAAAPASARLLAQDPQTGAPIGTFEGAVRADGAVDFVVECVRQAVLCLEYVVEEPGGAPQRVVSCLGRLVIEDFDAAPVDPSGIVYDAHRARRLVAGGTPPTRAIAQSALRGAAVTLERLQHGDWVTLAPAALTPATNPFVTGADGRYGWEVGEGTYRVTAALDDYRPAAATVDVPPAATALHLGLEPEHPVDPPAPPAAADPPAASPLTAGVPAPRSAPPPAAPAARPAAPEAARVAKKLRAKAGRCATRRGRRPVPGSARAATRPGRRSRAARPRPARGRGCRPRSPSRRPAARRRGG
jgi:hypothetical protein